MLGLMLLHHELPEVLSIRRPTSIVVQVLYLNNNKIEDSGAADFAHALKRNGVLEVLLVIMVTC